MLNLEDDIRYTKYLNGNSSLTLGINILIRKDIRKRLGKSNILDAAKNHARA